MKCKVCEKKLMKITMSHIKTHDGMTQEEYDNYNDIEPVEPEEEVETIWDSTDISGTEYKMKVAKLGKNVILMRNKTNVTAMTGKKCPGCHDKIYEPTAYVILRGKTEILAKQLTSPQNIKHKSCAIAEANLRDALGSVFFP